MDYFQCFRDAKILVSPRQMEKFLKLTAEFQKLNQELNLSAIREEKDIVIKHILDSLLIVHCIDFSHTKTVIDVGSGGGFPALPLALYFPDLKITACDSVTKKMDAVLSLASTFGTKNLKTVAARAEELGKQKEFREQYDVALARAVAPLSVVLEYLSPLVRTGGSVVAYKSKKAQSEVQNAKNAMKILGLELTGFHSFQLPDDSGSRTLLILKKIHNLSNKYPRSVGVPKKTPL